MNDSCCPNFSAHSELNYAVYVLSYLLVHIQLPEDFRGVQKMGIIHYSSTTSARFQYQDSPQPRLGAEVLI